MAKLTKLTQSPTFKATVKIPQAGDGGDLDLQFTFKHRTRDELQKFLDESRATPKVDAPAIMEMAVGWDLEDEFNVDSINTLLQHFITAPQAIFEKYIDELVKARAKN